ncbi:MAG: hypothetical protein ACTSPW_16305, partial [Promethearchaeota archaeon]
MVDNIIFYVKNNISWIKDIFTIIFTFTAIIISILTYRRARATVLQPIRNEVIKKQSKILSELLSFLYEYDNSIENGLDYLGLITINTFLSLKELGFIFKGDEKIIENLKDNVKGWIPCGESKILKDVKIIGIFDDDIKKNEKDFNDTRKERYENAKKGIIEINKIYLTNQYNKFMKRWSYFSDSPFLPISIKNILKKISIEININLTVN